MDSNFTVKTDQKLPNNVTFLVTLFVLLCYLFAKFLNLKKQKRNEEDLELLKQFHGLPNHPVLGSAAYGLHVFVAPSRVLLQWLEKMFDNYGPVWICWMPQILSPSEPKLMIGCAETAKKIYYNESLTKPPEIISGARIANSDGLISSPPEIHGPKRKLWTQWISRKRIKSSMPLFKQETELLCNQLTSFQDSGKNFEFSELVIFATFRIIASTAFGQAYVDSQPTSVLKQYPMDVHNFGKIFSSRLFRPWLFNDWIFLNLSSAGRQSTAMISRANNFASRAVTSRKLEKQQENLENYHGTSQCFTDYLLDCFETGLLAEQEIVPELNFFIAAGFDTTGLTISYCLYFLSLYPEHQKKCVDELECIFQGNLENAKHLNWDHVKDLKYLEMCINETLRFYPIAPISFRSATKPIEMPDGKIIPKDVDLYFNLKRIQMDPKYFPEPDKYDPTRHEKPNLAFMPFAAGPRDCVGRVYAMQSMKVIMTYLLAKFEWTTTENSNLPTLFIGAEIPTNGVRCTIKNRPNK